MANHKNNFYDVITDKRSLPYSTAITGTIETVGITVKGVGTKFLAEVQAGSWLIDLSTNESRRVFRTESDTVMFLSEAFTVNIAAGAVRQFVMKKNANPVEIEVFIPLLVAPGGANNPYGVIDGKVFPSGYARKLSKASKDDGSKVNIDPIIVDASSTSMVVSILY